jgi:hypothetical protein
MLLWYLVTGVLFAIAVGVWAIPIMRWGQFSQRSRMCLMIAMPTISLCAALWVFAIIYTAFGGNVGSLASDASGHKTTIGRLFSVAFLCGFVGIVSSSLAAWNTREPRLQAVATMGLIALGWWFFYASATY